MPYWIGYPAMWEVVTTGKSDYWVSIAGVLVVTGGAGNSRQLHELPPRRLPILDATDPRYGLDVLGRDRIIRGEPAYPAGGDTRTLHRDI
jgi:hypothetical protein